MKNTLFTGDMNREVLAFIPARGESSRILCKNVRNFQGQPLLVYTIRHALNSPFIDRTIVSTDSPFIASLAKRYGAEVPFLRPKRLATSQSNVADAIRYTLERLKRDEGYEPTYFVILQATSPLRQAEDIEACFKLITKTNATTVLTVAPTHPKFYHLKSNRDLLLVNGRESGPWRTQDWPAGYLLNACVYIVKTAAFWREGMIITKRTKAVVMPKWRSIDLDDPEEWAVAEVLFKNQNIIERIIKEIEDEKSHK